MKTNDPYELSRENFPKGALILSEDFYWDITDENSPLGNDTGSDIFFSFLEMQRNIPHPDPLIFLSIVMNEWGIPDEGWDSDSPSEIALGSQEEIFNLITRDDAVIGLAFSQIVVSGGVLAEIKQRALKAIKRQMLPEVTALRVGNSSPFDRAEKLRKMSAVLQQLRI